MPVEFESSGDVEILAVALKPLDLAVAAGRFYGGHPPLPFIPGCEAVGARLERARELGADAVVQLEGDELAERLREACGGGPNLIVDPLWGEPVRAAVEAAAPGARIFHVGQSAGLETTLSSADVRGKQLCILGYSNFALSTNERRQSYLELASTS